MSQTVRELIESLQQIENQDQQVVSLIMLAQDVLKYDPETGQDEHLTPAEFAEAVGKTQKSIDRALAEACEYVAGEIYEEVAE